MSGMINRLKNLKRMLKDTTREVKKLEEIYKLSSKQKHLLWTVVSFNRVETKTLRKMGFSKRVDKTLNRLMKKGLVVKSKVQSVFSATSLGKDVLFYNIQKTRNNKNGTFNAKLVCFDLDDLLIPGYTNVGVDVQQMKFFLQILKFNGIHTSVLSINSNETVYERMRDYGLLEYFDSPFFTQKGEGIEVLKERLSISDSDVIFYGHDLVFDYDSVRRVNKKVRIVLIKDSFSLSDQEKKANVPEDTILINRTLDEMLGVITKTKVKGDSGMKVGKIGEKPVSALEKYLKDFEGGGK